MLEKNKIKYFDAHVENNSRQWVVLNAISWEFTQISAISEYKWKTPKQKEISSFITLIFLTKSSQYDTKNQLSQNTKAQSKKHQAKMSRIL